MSGRSRKIAALGTAVAAATMTVTVAGSAGAATTGHQVRQADFISAYSDTRSGGAYGFGPRGLVVETKGNADLVAGTTQNADKVAEYFKPATTALPSSGSYVWDGTGLQNRPGSQIVFHRAGQTASDYNVLVGEDFYSTTDPSANPELTDWWYTGGSGKATGKGIVCPSTTGGSGSDCHGTLAQWQNALPGAVVDAVGFSLGSGVQGSGVLSSLTFGDDTYTFTADPASSTGTGGSTQVAPPVALTGKVVHAARGRNTYVTLSTDTLPAGATAAAPVQWQILTGPRGGALHERLATTTGAGQTVRWRFTFPVHQSRREVRVLQDGKVVADYTLR